MVTKTVSADEWTELVGANFEDDYSIVVEDAGVYLYVGDKPAQPVAGLPLSSGAMYSAQTDRGERIYARSQTDVDSTVRVVPNIRIEGSNERAVSVQTSVRSNSFDRGDSFSSSSGYPIELSPPETIQELMLSIVEGEVSVVITTTDGDELTIPVDAKTTISSLSIESATIEDSQATSPRVAGGWAGQ